MKLGLRGWFLRYAAIALAFAACARAGTSGDSGSVVVTVVDESGQPLVGTAVSALDESSELGRDPAAAAAAASASTDGQGEAVFALGSGRFRFRARCELDVVFSGPAGHCSIPGCRRVRLVLVCRQQCRGQRDGTPCNDGDACTQKDTCRGGVCLGSSPVTCAAQDQCHAAGTCDPGTGACTNPAAPDGTACDDGDACTLGDSCQAGSCVPAGAVACAPIDQCHVAGLCDPATGFCSNPAAADGTSCNDGNACTRLDTCERGRCVGASPVVCAASDQCHVAGVCDPSTGACSNPAAAEGTACNDGNACTQTDACAAGRCVGSNATVCTAQDQCHVAGVCDPATGFCSNPPAAEGTACNDNDACTQVDACAAGRCVGGSPTVCNAQDQCHTPGVCDKTTGICSNPVAADGTSCSDGNACTQTDACAAGRCVGSNPVVCTALDQCHVAGVCDGASGNCSNPAVNDGTTCDDGNACTLGDNCRGGTCAAGTSSCVSLAVRETSTSASAAVQLALALAADRPQVVPGDLLVLTARATNSGTGLDLRGTLDLVNMGTAPFTVRGFQQTLEYFSTTQQAWVVLASFARDNNGAQVPPPAAQLPLQLVSLDPAGTPGVTRGTDVIFGAQLAVGATATWGYHWTAALPPGAVQTVFQSGDATGIRLVWRFDTSVSPVAVDASGQADVTTALAGFTGVAATATVTLSLEGGATTVSGGPIGSGETVPFSGTLMAPLVPPRGATETDTGYINRLLANTVVGFTARASVSGQAVRGSVVGPSAQLSLPRVVPVLTVAKSGPPEVLAGSTGQYTATLQNAGNAGAGPIAITDSVDGAPVPASIAPPATLAPAETRAVGVQADVPAARPAGPMTDIVSVTWQDRNGNTYGPVNAAFTTTVRAAAAGALVLLSDTALAGAGAFALGDEAMGALGLESGLGLDSGWVATAPAGRLVIDATDATVMLVSGMAVTVLRRYDSLLADQVGDFGHGWSLLVEPRLEAAPAAGGEVAVLLPQGQRFAFAFTPQAYSPLLATLRRPAYTAEAPGSGTLTSNGCSLLAMDGPALGAAASGGGLLCFLEGGLEYRPTSYVYTDPAGRAFHLAATGELVSIDDRPAGAIVVSPAGLTGSAGEPSVPVDRDGAGRVLRIGTGDAATTYDYDSAGDLALVTLPTGGVEYSYDPAHRLRATRDPRDLRRLTAAPAPLLGGR